jgi:ABC-type multidrug transport system fused ATPase/permease subunit
MLRIRNVYNLNRSNFNRQVLLSVNIDSFNSKSSIKPPKYQLNNLYRQFSTDNNDNKSKKKNINIIKEVAPLLWPDSSENNSSSIKKRVVASVSLLVASKLINIQVPFIFKSLIDTFSIDVAEANSAVISSLEVTPAVAEVIISAPIALVLGYGIARSTAAGFAELRNAIFAKVAHGAIRKISRNIFVQLHNMDMQFHIDRNTGALSRSLDRGAKSINFALSQLLFNVIPTAFEVCLVSGILVYNLGPAYGMVAFSTVGLYTVFTIMVSNKRVLIRKEMNNQESVASGIVIDSLINFENVQLFSNENHEANRYDNALKKFQEVRLYL